MDYETWNTPQELQLSFENIQNTSRIFRLSSNELLPVVFMISNEV